MQNDATKIIEANEGILLGAVRHPINTPDFSSFLLQAQASKPDVIVLADAGADTVNAIKQAGEFGLALALSHQSRWIISDDQRRGSAWS